MSENERKKFLSECKGEKKRDFKKYFVHFFFSREALECSSLESITLICFPLAQCMIKIYLRNNINEQS